MNPAYRIPDNPCACVEPGTKPAHTIPINRMNTRSLIVEPVPGSLFRSGKAVEVKGLAFSGGYGVRDVTVSVNGGQTWHEAALGKDLGTVFLAAVVVPLEAGIPGEKYHYGQGDRSDRRFAAVRKPLESFGIYVEQDRNR